jgi:hypothetical protein
MRSLGFPFRCFDGAALSVAPRRRRVEPERAELLPGALKSAPQLGHLILLPAWTGTEDLRTAWQAEHSIAMAVIDGCLV